MIGIILTILALIIWGVLGFMLFLSKIGNGRHHFTCPEVISFGPAYWIWTWLFWIFIAYETHKAKKKLGEQ